MITGFPAPCSQGWRQAGQIGLTKIERSHITNGQLFAGGIRLAISCVANGASVGRIQCGSLQHWAPGWRPCSRPRPVAAAPPAVAGTVGPVSMTFTEPILEDVNGGCAALGLPDGGF